MRQIVCEKNQAPLPPPAGPEGHLLESTAPESQQPVRAGGESDGQLRADTMADL